MKIADLIWGFTASIVAWVLTFSAIEAAVWIAIKLLNIKISISIG